MLITRKLNREKVMAHNPTHIGTVGNVRFYEHPIHGDESPLIAETKTEFGLTDFWELPEITEIYEFTR